MGVGGQGVLEARGRENRSAKGLGCRKGEEDHSKEERRSVGRSGVGSGGKGSSGLPAPPALHSH